MSRTSPSSPSAPPPEGASAEQLASLPNGIELCYQTFGDPSADPLLLVMGLGGPMTWWDPDFCGRLADAGFFVIRYDNRDTGRSSRVRPGHPTDDRGGVRGPSVPGAVHPRRHGRRRLRAPGPPRPRL